MSATYSWDVAEPLWLRMLLDFEQLNAIKSKFNQRWQGVYKPRWTCYTLQIKLPKQLKVMYLLYKCLISFHPTSLSVENQVRTLLKKVCLGLGIPQTGWTHLFDQEFQMLRTIDKNPEDFDLWRVYADYLEEYGRTSTDRLRAEVIRGWLGPKPIKTKYGIPVIMRTT